MEFHASYSINNNDKNKMGIIYRHFKSHIAFKPFHKAYIYIYIYMHIKVVIGFYAVYLIEDKGEGDIKFYCNLHKSIYTYIQNADRNKNSSTSKLPTLTYCIIFFFFLIFSNINTVKQFAQKN